MFINQKNVSRETSKVLKTPNNLIERLLGWNNVHKSKTQQLIYMWDVLTVFDTICREEAKGIRCGDVESARGTSKV